MTTRLQTRAAYLIHWQDETVSGWSVGMENVDHNFVGYFTPVQFTEKIREWRRQGLLTAGCHARRGAPCTLDKCNRRI